MPRERATIEAIARLVSVRPGVDVGVGDDAAVLSGPPPLLVAHDMLVEGTHFTRGTSSAGDLGHRALAVNLSDIAAMGGRPIAAVVGLALPDDVPESDVTAFYASMESLAARHGVTVAGGDLTRGPSIVVGVSIIGCMDEGIRPVLRSGARPGDLVAVTGALGAAAAGLALLDDPRLETSTRRDDLLVAQRRPTARVDEGRRLAAAGISAMMDISDGLALDATRLAEASAVGITIDLDRVPRASGVDAVADALGRPADEFAATGGEDYELLVTAPPDVISRCAAGIGLPVTVIGEVTDGPVGLLLLRGGRQVVPSRLGWEI